MPLEAPETTVEGDPQGPVGPAGPVGMLMPSSELWDVWDDWDCGDGLSCGDCDAAAERVGEWTKTVSMPLLMPSQSEAKQSKAK